MTEIETKIKNQLIGKKLTDIEIYNVNDSFFVIDSACQWVFDAGIQLNLDLGIFSLGWDTKLDGFDYSLEKAVVDFFAAADYFRIDSSKNAKISELLGLKITDVSIEWTKYQTLDENYDLSEEEQYFPTGLEITFEFNKSLQIGLIDFEINENPIELINPRYNMSGNLLISIGKKVNIVK